MTRNTFPQAELFPNPYYESRQWKVWLHDSSPVENAGQQLKAPPVKERKRIVPSIVDGKPHFELKNLGNSDHGAMWDDVYVNQDNGHSGFSHAWPDPKSKFKIKGQLIEAKMPLVILAVEDKKIVNKGPTDLKKIGANFTSQSTTHMGHHLANNGLQVAGIEKEFYFANVLRAGPAHISFREKNAGPTEDLYEALVPSFFNSYGSSGSEMHGLMKMVMAGSFINTELKKKIKHHGIYPATLLYIWKKTLPYGVPYAHELRHKVAYFTKGDHTNYSGPTKAHYNFEYHAFDENEHIKAMIREAISLKESPPVSILASVKNSGGLLVYAARTAALIRQNKEDVSIKFSAKDSYDIQGKKLTFRCVRICGNSKTRIKQVDGKSFEISVPFDPKMPKGRTSILLIANNGLHDSNPAVINIYNGSGTANKRPTLKVPDSLRVMPGKTVRIPFETHDPEGFPVETVILNDSDSKVTIENNEIVFHTRPDAKIGDSKFSVLVSDKTSGSGQNSHSITASIKPIVANINHVSKSEKAPRVVFFSGINSRNVDGSPIDYQWKIDGITRSNKSTFENNFTQPGVFIVELTAKSNGDSSNTKTVIEVKDDWPIALDNGWNKSDLLSWKLINDSSRFAQSSAGPQIVRTNKANDMAGLISSQDFEIPFRIDVTYRRARYGAGAGIKILGVLIGDPVGADTKGRTTLDTSIARKNRDGRWIYKYITKNPKTPAQDAVLRCYVTKDPSSSGRKRFSGFLENENGKKPFYMDNLNCPTKGKIEILLGANAVATIKKFKVFAAE